MAPVASEDLLALANQGVVPEELGLEFAAEADECIDFVPIAGTSNSDVALAIQQHIWDSSIKKEDEVIAPATVTSVKKEEEWHQPPAVIATQVPAKPNGIASKRKVNDEILCSSKGAVSGSGPLQETKKPRRSHKTRSKRSKI
jgi:hypothetical protein